MLASKMYESYVLEWLQKQVKVKNNQYGGVKGRSADHMLIGIWDRICGDLEDCRAGSVLTSIDYAKAFNRLSYQECLRAFARKGASSNLLAILASFLTNRTMVVKVDQAWSSPRPVCGGAPQGSILGVFLFNITTDNLEDASSVDDQRDALEAGLGPELAADSSGSSIGADDSPPPVSRRGPVDASSPVGEIALGRPPVSPVLPPGYVVDRTFFFLPNARNTHRFRSNPIVYSSEGEITPPPEPSPVTSAKWVQRPPLCLK